MNMTPDERNEKANAVIKEMAPFAINAAIPILITIAIALTFGTSRR